MEDAPSCTFPNPMVGGLARHGAEDALEVACTCRSSGGKVVLLWGCPLGLLRNSDAPRHVWGIGVVFD